LQVAIKRLANQEIIAGELFAEIQREYVPHISQMGID